MQRLSKTQAVLSSFLNVPPSEKVVVSPTVCADGARDMCGLCWVCLPVQALDSEAASDEPLQLLARTIQRLPPGEADGDLEGAVPVHRRMGGQIHPLNGRDGTELVWTWTWISS